MNDSAPLNGILRGGLPLKLKKGNDVLIGSDPRKCMVVIDGAESVHATISLKRIGFESGYWNIRGNEFSATFLNGNDIGSETEHLLSNGDSIVIAGVQILFSAGRLEEDKREEIGVAVDVRNLTDVRAGNTLLRDVSFSVEEGEFIGILGPSGCGKTTLIQRIAGLATFKKGKICVNGHSVSNRKEHSKVNRLMAYLPQSVEKALHPELTIREELAFARKIYLAPTNADEKLDKECLEVIGLDDKLDETIGKLSGGEKRRVAIALALQRDPQLLLFDEPTAGLDPATETDVMKYLQRLSRQGRTVFCATHIMDNIQLFDKVLVLTGGGKQEKGRAIFFGRPSELLTYFNASSYSDFYRILQDKATDYQSYIPASPDIPDPWKLPDIPKVSSFSRTVFGYFGRQIKVFSCATIRPQSILDIIFPAPLRIYLFTPLLIICGIKWACGSNFSDYGNELSGGISTVLFCAALSVFWLGLIGNVQEMVKERIPGRCLDRLNGICTFRYFTSKVIRMVLSCLILTVVFTLLFFVIPPFCGSGDKDILSKPLAISNIPYVMLVLWGVSFLGGCWGLLVSSVAKKTTAAVMAVPTIAIFALFFSQPVVGFGPKDDPCLQKWGWCQKCNKYVVRNEKYLKVKDYKEDESPSSYYECCPTCETYLRIKKDDSLCCMDAQQVYSSAAKFSRFMPCYQPQVLMAKLVMVAKSDDGIVRAPKKEDKNLSNKGLVRPNDETIFDYVAYRFAILLLTMGGGTLLLAYFSQSVNERIWEGR